ncbi:TPA: site-specific integrase [Vibrio parahaemolyticus]|uniref:site-specific integrase n=1 Tax=uncultured Vibrio sp. TaxID=114054 RepID=UPI001A21FF6F|nr:site-specific integrase [uncultured Vibrio sp.]HAS6902114.1 site-specific integrase [Vibrio parahaemolyticus]
MILRRILINYNYEFRDISHHVLYTKYKGESVLLSAVNLFLYERCTSSIKTSDRYSQLFLRFFNFLIDTSNIDITDTNFWRLATTADIKAWQGFQVKNRDSNNKSKPQDDTIYYNALIIFDFYVWAKNKGFPTLIRATSKDWIFNYRDESRLLKSKNMLSGSSPDTGNIDIGKRSSRSSNRNKRSRITIMKNEDIRLLMSSFDDKVYPSILMLALSTGLRSSGCCDFPYIGYGENHHIRVYPDIENTIRNTDGTIPKTFSYTVEEKGSKVRTIQVNLAAWKSICEFYYPLYLERRKLFIKKYPKLIHDNYFFLTSKGDPVTPKKIADATTYIKSKPALKGFKWSFRNSRDWYATNFVLKRLTRKQIENNYYDHAVDKALQDQLGHADLRTTYMFYVRVASLILHLESGMLDYTLGKDETFWNSLKPKERTEQQFAG